MRARRFCGHCGARLGNIVDDRQDCPGCAEPFYHGAKPCSAVLVVDQAGRVLLARRGVEPRRGLWDLPGGFCAPDETPEECARRELREETGCDIMLEGFLGHLVDVYGDHGDHTLNAVFVARIVAGEPRPADDVEELHWFALEELPSPEQLAFANTAAALALLIGS